MLIMRLLEDSTITPVDRLAAQNDGVGKFVLAGEELDCGHFTSLVRRGP